MRPHRFFIAMALAASSAFANEEILLGAGHRGRPKYDGSDRQTTELVPVLRYYGGPLFARTTHGMLEGGLRIAVARGLRAGVQIGHEPGPRDEDPGSSVGAHVEWTTRLGAAPLNALARYRSHVESERGRLFDTRVTMGVYGSGALGAGIFGQATWASEEHMRAHYDVWESGLLYTSAGILGSYQLGSRWSVIGSTELRRLASNPAQSAVVQDRTNGYITVGAAYRF
jgi:outer membrane scaffolding protein for murein synthesis (MipA/OmpV family)